MLDLPLQIRYNNRATLCHTCPDYTEGLDQAKEVPYVRRG